MKVGIRIVCDEVSGTEKSSRRSCKGQGSLISSCPSDVRNLKAGVSAEKRKEFLKEKTAAGSHRGIRWLVCGCICGK